MIRLSGSWKSEDIFSILENCGSTRTPRDPTRYRRVGSGKIFYGYTNGHFCCFDCLLTVFDHWCTNRHRSTKTVPTVYQQCTNRQKQSRDRQNSKNHRCCTNRHMSTQSPPNTQSPAAVSSTLEEWTRTFSRRQQCTVVLELPYSTEFGRSRSTI